MKKNFKWIILGIVMVIFIGGVVIYGCLFKKEKEKTVDNQSKDTILEKVDLSLEDPLDNIKPNVVKIINKVGASEIVGTGFFIPSGYLITNSHVVDIKGDIVVKYANGKESAAAIVSNDIVSDLAILKVDKIEVLALSFGDTLNLKTTDKLYAMGFAFNLDGEVTTTEGILSARRSIAGIEYLQTDAAINKGASGGPLLDSKGNVVGMNSLSNENTTIGMALSSETLQNLITKLLDEKKVNYLTEDRPKNALSSVLTETGYGIEDLYDEWEFFHIGEEKPKKQTEKEIIVVTPKQKSMVSELSYLGVKGYNIGWGVDNAHLHLYITNNEDKVELVVTPKDNKATYSVRGNENLQSAPDGAMTITVTAEDGIHKTEYFIIWHNVKSYFANLVNATISSQITNDWRTNSDVLRFEYELLDSNNHGVYSYPKIAGINTNIYVCTKGVECSDNSEYTLLKSYNLPQTKYGDKYEDIKLSEIKGLLQNGNYFVDGNVKIYTDNTLNTVSQGSYKGISYHTITQ